MGSEFHCIAHRSQPTINLWRRPRSSNSRVLVPCSTRKTRKRSPPLMKAFGTRKLVEPCHPKKSASGCRSGLPPPLHAKGAERSRRNHRPHSRGRRGCSLPLRQFPVGPCGSSRPLSAHGGIVRRRPHVRELVHSPFLIYYRIDDFTRLIEVLHL